MHQCKIESESKFFFKHNFQSEIRVDTNENMCTKNNKNFFSFVSVAWICGDGKTIEV